MTPQKLKIVTANRLGDGAVVYLDADGDWSARLGNGWVALDQDDETALLARAAQAEADLLIVGAYSMEVARLGDGLAPTSQRERIRSAGPTVAAGEVPAALPATPRRSA
jgi:sulfite reductase (NADPH) hemoprotein beta-component